MKINIWQNNFWKYLAKYFLNKQSTKIFLFPILIQHKKYFRFVIYTWWRKFFINPKTTTTLPHAHANKGCAWGISVQIQASAVIEATREQGIFNIMHLCFIYFWNPWIVCTLISIKYWLSYLQPTGDRPHTCLTGWVNWRQNKMDPFSLLIYLKWIHFVLPSINSARKASAHNWKQKHFISHSVVWSVSGRLQVAQPVLYRC